ncbi:MAG: hypothetical protein ACRCZF_24290 [Gemmataceae bacterium]
MSSYKVGGFPNPEGSPPAKPSRTRYSRAWKQALDFIARVLGVSRKPDPATVRRYQAEIEFLTEWAQPMAAAHPEHAEVIAPVIAMTRQEIIDMADEAGYFAE